MKTDKEMFNYDLERMKMCLSSPLEIMPHGLSKEEKMSWLMGEWATEENNNVKNQQT